MGPNGRRLEHAGSLVIFVIWPKLGWTRRLSHNSADSFLQDPNIEVDQQSQAQIGGLQVRDDLARVKAADPWNRLHLNQDNPFDDQIDSMSRNVPTLVGHCYLFLTLEAKPGRVQLETECLYVDPLLEPGA